MRKGILIIGLIVFQYLILSVAFAADKPDKEKKQTPFHLYLTAAETYDLKQQQGGDVYLVDIRTPGEVMFVGIANEVDVHVPYLLADYRHWNPKKKQFAMQNNPDFASDLERGLSKAKLGRESPIILMCRSGSRSAKAARVLHGLGYSQVYSVIDGFEGDTAKTGSQKGQRVVNGWKNAGLPWSYRARKEQLPLLE